MKEKKINLSFYLKRNSTKKELKIMDNRRQLDSQKIFPKLYKEALN